ncbi:MAG: cytochrome P450 [Gemmataceae bacterium]
MSMAATALPPGPPGRFLTGNLPDLRRDLLELYERAARTYGDVATLRFGLRRIFLISHPDLIEQVLTSRAFVKHYALRMNKMLLGNGLLTSEGDEWLRQRRLIQPAFLRDRLAGYGGTMVEYSHRWAAGWRDGERRDMHADMRQLTMEIAAKTLFGADVSGQGAAVADALRDVMESFIRRLFRVVVTPEWLPTPTNVRAWRSIRRLDRILYGIIAQRRTAGAATDLLSLLLHAHDEAGGMSDKQLRDEAMTLFLAGHETTALTLTYTLHLLARHPAAQDALRAEVNGLGDRLPTFADLPRLRFTEQVVLEGMRLYPPAYVIGRQAVEPVELGGYRLPAGSTLLLPQWVVHRDPRFWEAPAEFRPQRWTDAMRERLPKFAYFPFGGGPRICIGNNFALIEATLVLATLLRRWAVRPASDRPLAFRPRMTLAPDGPVELTVHPV